MAKTIETKVQHSEARYMRILAEEVVPDDFRAIVRKAKEQALAGDAQARLFIASFLCGLPSDTAPRLSLLDEIDASDELMQKLLGGES